MTAQLQLCHWPEKLEFNVQRQKFATDTFFVSHPDTDFLNGFSISDLILNANLSGASAVNGAGGIFINGKNVTIRSVTVKDYGSKADNLTICGISVSNLTNSSPAPSNVIFDNCSIVRPFDNSGLSCRSIALNLGLIGSGAISQGSANSVIRNCFLDGAAPTSSIERYGIVAESGTGIVVERNRIMNFKYGGPSFDSAFNRPPSDKSSLIVRDNYYRNCARGISFLVTNSGGINPFGRILVQQNIFEIENVVGNQAISFKGSVDSLQNPAFSELIIRGNRIRALDGASPVTGMFGIFANSVSQLAIDNNWVDIGSIESGAVNHGTAGKVYVFNNRRLDKTFIPVAISGGPLHEGELTSEPELVMTQL